MAIEIRLASTEEDREKIFRFKYDIYVREMQFNLVCADHERQAACEPLDLSASLIGAFEDGEIVGTVRTNYAWNSNLSYHVDLLNLKWAESYFPQQVSMTTKLMVLKKYRGGMLKLRLAKAAYRTARIERVEFDFIFCKPHLISLFIACGYRQYIDRVDLPEFGEVTPMILAISDIDHLESVRSPFLSIAREFPVNHDAVELMRRRSRRLSMPRRSPPLHCAIPS